MYILANEQYPSLNSEASGGHMSVSGGINGTARTFYVFWPETLNTDEARLRQILINIVLTSICYTNQGYVRIYSEVNEYTRIFSIIVEDSSLGLTE